MAAAMAVERRLTVTTRGSRERVAPSATPAGAAVEAVRDGLGPRGTVRRASVRRVEVQNWHPMSQMLSAGRRRDAANDARHGFPAGASLAVTRTMEASRAGTVGPAAEDDPHALSGYLEFLGPVGVSRPPAAWTAGASAGPRDGSRHRGIRHHDARAQRVRAGRGAARRQAHVHLPILGMTGHWTTEIQSERSAPGSTRCCSSLACRPICSPIFSGCCGTRG